MRGKHSLKAQKYETHMEKKKRTKTPLKQMEREREKKSVTISENVGIMEI